MTNNSEEETSGIETFDSLENPLSRELNNVLGVAYMRYKGLVQGLNPEALSEPERSGVIFINTLIKDLDRSRKEIEYYDYLNLIANQVNYLSELATSLPAWIPYIFKGYFKEGLSQQELDFYAIGAFEIEKYFDRGGLHNFILNVLSISDENSEYVKSQKFGNKTIPVLDIGKVLGEKSNAYKNAASLDDSMEILKRKVKFLAVKKRIKLQH